MRQTRINVIRGRLIEKAHRLISEIIFNKTYFSLEETGLAFPCIPLKRSEWRDRCLDGHRKTGHAWTSENRPCEVA